LQKTTHKHAHRRPHCARNFSTFFILFMIRRNQKAYLAVVLSSVVMRKPQPEREGGGGRRGGRQTGTEGGKENFLLQCASTMYPQTSPRGVTVSFSRLALLAVPRRAWPRRTPRPLRSPRRGHVPRPPWIRAADHPRGPRRTAQGGILLLCAGAAGVDPSPPPHHHHLCPLLLSRLAGPRVPTGCVTRRVVVFTDVQSLVDFQ